MLDQLGSRRPLSHRATASRFTPTRSASCSCVKPACSRNSRRRPGNHAGLVIASFPGIKCSQLDLKCLQTGGIVGHELTADDAQNVILGCRFRVPSVHLLTIQTPDKEW